MSGEGAVIGRRLGPLGIQRCRELLTRWAIIEPCRISLEGGRRRGRLGSGRDRLGSGRDRLGSGRDRLGSGRDRLGSGRDRLGSGRDRLGGVWC